MKAPINTTITTMAMTRPAVHGIAVDDGRSRDRPLAQFLAFWAFSTAARAPPIVTRASTAASRTPSVDRMATRPIPARITTMAMTRAACISGRTRRRSPRWRPGDGRPPPAVHHAQHDVLTFSTNAKADRPVQDRPRPVQHGGIASLCSMAMAAMVSRAATSSGRTFVQFKTSLDDGAAPDVRPRAVVQVRSTAVGLLLGLRHAIGRGVDGRVGLVGVAPVGELLGFEPAASRV